MKISYKPLWKLLIDRDTKEDLRFVTGLSADTIAKMSKDDNATTDLLAHICTELHCGLEQVAEVAVSHAQGGDRDE